MIKHTRTTGKYCSSLLLHSGMIDFEKRSVRSNGINTAAAVTCLSDAAMRLRRAQIPFQLSCHGISDAHRSVFILV